MSVERSRPVPALFHRESGPGGSGLATPPGGGRSERRGIARCAREPCSDLITTRLLRLHGGAPFVLDTADPAFERDGASNDTLAGLVRKRIGEREGRAGVNRAGAKLTSVPRR